MECRKVTKVGTIPRWVAGVDYKMLQATIGRKWSIVKPFFREPLAVHHSAWFCQPCDVIGSGSNQGWSFLVFERRRWDMNCGWKNASYSAPLALPRDPNGLVWPTLARMKCSGQVAHMLVLDWFEVLMKICVQDWNALLNMLKRLRSRNM